MTKLDRLKHEARDAATWRGHDLDRFHNYSKTAAQAYCKKCQCGVVVDTHPLPNSIEIAGKPVAVNCWTRA